MWQDAEDLRMWSLLPKAFDLGLEWTSVWKTVAVIVTYPKRSLIDGQFRWVMRVQHVFDIGREATLRAYASVCPRGQPIPLGFNVTWSYPICPFRGRLVGLIDRQPLYEYNNVG